MSKESMFSQPTPDPRILGQRIAEARKASGKTQEEVADFLGYSRPTYIAMEKGERPVKSEEVVKLASFFGRMVNELVRPTPPVVGFQPHFRASPEKLTKAEEAALQIAVEKFERLAEDYRDLEQLMGAPLRTNYPAQETLNPRTDPAQLAEGVAQKERQRLGLGDQPVSYLRSTLEWDVGLRIFYGDLPAKIAGMYAFTTDLGCCIFVNKKHPPERRRLTMLHEYGHLIVDRYKPASIIWTEPGANPPMNGSPKRSRLAS
jgi:transcriptional regulator with XRE-family HTH domain